jgi:alkylation response protein AidB-like acyl-CoA dehydrogenase
VDLILTDEQRILRESAAKLVAGWAGRRKLAAPRRAPIAFERDVWRDVAEAGWLAILVPEEQGGLGLGLTELCLVAEAIGRGPLLEPVGAVAVAAGALAASTDAALRDDLVARLVAGERVVVPVLEDDAPLQLGAGSAAAGVGERVRLTGTAPNTPHGSVADGLLVAARGDAGPVLCHVACSTAGVRAVERRTVDGADAAAVSFADAEARVVVGADRAPGLIARARDQLVLAASAELLGAMEQAHTVALEYARTRQQFDRPIGSFQALQHRAVTDHIEVELTRSLLYQVCAALDEDRAGPGLASAVKAKASAAALAVTKSAIQMHGAIGYTSELDVGRYMKRAMTLAAQHGNAAWHRRRYAQAIGLEEARPTDAPLRRP